jgi:hypothetical protein
MINMKQACGILMYKVCLDNNNNIVGFDLKNSIYYINLFDINNVTKDIKQYKEEQLKDSLGRKLYYQHNKQEDDTSVVYIIDNNSTNYEYTPIITNIPIINEVFLIKDTNYFSLDNLISIKKEQLIKNFNCKDCILYEMLDSPAITFNANIGKNVIKIYSNSEAISNKIEMSNNSKIAIYYEANQDLNIAISDDAKTWIQIKRNEFIDYNNKEIFIKFISTTETDITSISILIN